jgi:hypothetical protein
MVRSAVNVEKTRQPWRRFGGDRHAQRATRPLGPGSDPNLETEFDPGLLQPGQLHWKRRYTRARINMLARQYVKLRSDLLVAVQPNWSPTDQRRTYARRGKEYLELARVELLDRRPRIYVCSGLLYLAEINLTWLLPQGMLNLRCEEAVNRLESLHKAGVDDVEWLLRNLRSARQMDDVRWLRAALADAFECFSEQDARLLMNDDLQVTRLRILLWYVGIALVLLVLAVPYVTSTLSQGIPGWPVFHLGKAWLTQTVSALAIAAVGAVGGIFSGLISTRDSSTTLDEYRTSMLKLALKPMVGAIASVTLYLMLSWQILTGVKVTNGGTFLLVGFLAGFSERYFLRLLRAAPEDHAGWAGGVDRLVSSIPARSIPTSEEGRHAFFDGDGGRMPSDPSSTSPTEAAEPASPDLAEPGATRSPPGPGDGPPGSPPP